MTAPTEKFFAAAWMATIEGREIDGAELLEMFERCGLAESRPATQADIENSPWEGDLEPGDPIMFLTEAGRAAVTSAARA